MKEVVPSNKQAYKKNMKQETSSKKMKVEQPEPILGKRKVVQPKKNEPKKYKQGERRHIVEVDDSDTEFEDAPPAAPPPGQDVEFDDVSEDAQSDDAQSDQSDDANEGDAQAESKTSSKYDLQALSKSQLTGIAPYGAILDKLTPEQIDQLIASGNGLTIDGRGLLKTRPSPSVLSRKRRQRSMRGNDGQIIYFKYLCIVSELKTKNGRITSIE